jgi:hypothetical protein
MTGMAQEDNNPESPDANRQTDERLVHALLLHMHDGSAGEDREQRVQRVMQAVREPRTPQSPSAPRSAEARPARTQRLPVWARRSAAAAAAVVLVAVGVWVFTSSPKPAMASLNDMISAMGRPGDRTYHIHMEDVPAPPERRPPDDPSPERVPRPGLNNATLYLRDGQQYVLVRDDPRGGVISDGYDGRQSWRIRAGVLAETKEGLGAGGIPMPPIMAGVPFSDLHQTLERIRVDYTIEKSDQAPLPPGGRALQHVRVRRNSREVKGPETIDIWADPQTATPRRIVFDRAKLQGNREPCRLTFDLVSDKPLPADWFRPAPHVASGAAGGPRPRPVDRGPPRPQRTGSEL